MRSYKNQKGFTLVELAIVLIIIGLIVSSVLVGQDIIKAAELRATTTQLNKFQTAVNVFIGKFGGIPGDVNGANFFTTGAGTSDGTAGKGDSNGIITRSGSASAINTLTGEITDFWAHLSAGAGLIPGTYDGDDGNSVSYDFPILPFGALGWGVYGVSAQNYFVAGVASASSYTLTNAFVPVDAFNIDDKIDDGAPLSGAVQALSGKTAGSPNDQADTTIFKNAGASSAYCVDSTATSGTYQFTATTAHCNLRFNMDTF